MARAVESGAKSTFLETRVMVPNIELTLNSYSSSAQPVGGSIISRRRRECPHVRSQKYLAISVEGALLFSSHGGLYNCRKPIILRFR